MTPEERLRSLFDTQWSTGPPTSDLDGAIARARPRWLRRAVVTWATASLIGVVILGGGIAARAAVHQRPASSTATPVTTSAPTVSSTGVTPTRRPGAPTAVKATAGDSHALVSWTPPSTLGGSAPSYTYVVTASPGGVTTKPTTNNSTTVFNLTNGVSYTFTVTATNAAGTSAPSAPSNTVTPSLIIK